MFLLQGYQLGQVSSYHGLIARNYGNTPAESIANYLIRSVGIVDYLDYKVNPGVVEYVGSTVGKQLSRGLDAARLCEIAHTYAADFGMCIGGLADNLVNPLADNAEAKESYTNFIIH